MQTIPERRRVAELSEIKGALLAKRVSEAASLERAGRITPRSPDTTPPVSFAQERIWFLEQYVPGTAAYTIPMALRLHGRLDRDALERALSTIVTRHETLRTRFPRITGEGRPLLVIDQAPEFELPLIVLRERDLAARERRATELLSEEASRPFDLTAGGLLRALLVRLAENDHALLLAVHHIAADGWSFGILLEELAALYSAFREGRRSPLPELPIQYGDYALAQREQLTGCALDGEVAYWRGQLAEIAPLELPTDRARPPEQTFSGAICALELERSLTDALAALGRRHGATLYMTLLASFQVLLARYSDQHDFAVGSPIAGRDRPEVEGLIGMFVNMLTMRCDLSGDPSFLDVLAATRRTSLEAYAHRTLPFEQLVNELQPHRDLSRSPLFQVVFGLDNTPAASVTLAGLTHCPFELEIRGARFDLELQLAEREAGLEGFFSYNVDLFERATVDRFASHFETLLRSIVRSPDARLSDLELMNAAERRLVVCDWNANEADFADSTLQQKFEAQAARTPDATALVFEGETLSYRELNERANRIAHRLRREGVGPEDLVALSAERSPQLVAGLVGILKAGAAYVPLDPEYPPERLAFMLDDSRASVLLTQRGLLDALAGCTAAVLCLDEQDEFAGVPDGNPEPLAGPENVAYVIYTSGSTGRPKGVPNTQRGICNRLDWMQKTYQLDSSDSVLQKTPASFDVSVWELFWPLLVGAKLVLARPGGHKDAAYLRDLIVEEGITTLHFVPSMLAVFLAEEEIESCRSVRRAICSGEELPPELVRRYFDRMGGELHNLYGPTEAAIDVSFWPCRPEHLAGRTSTPIGRPIQNIQLYVLDDGLKPQPIGVPGELHIGGVGLARGYLNRPALTAERFVPDPFANDGSRLYKTGDRARLLADGAIEFLGRLDNQVKIRGYRIELGEIEAALRERPEIAEAAVIAREDVPGDRRLVGYVVPAAGEHPDEERVRKALMLSLPDYLVPAALVSLESLPLTPNGKLDRKALPAPAAYGGRAGEFAAPRTQGERELAQIWTDVLRIERVGVDDNFFDLGGHSLLAAQVVAQARAVVRPRGRPLCVMDLFKYPTIRELAGLAELDPDERGAERLLHELTRSQQEPVLTFVCVPYAGGSAITYQPLAEALPEGYLLYALAIPGHDPSLPDEERLALEEVAARVVEEILEGIEGPLALYGHCVGSALTIEIARRLEAAGRKLEAVYIGGSFPVARPPGWFFELLARAFPLDRFLGARSFHAWLRTIGGGVDLMGDADVEFLIRNLREDFRAAEEYFGRACREPPRRRLRAPVISIVGEIDPLTDFYEERYREWGLFSQETALEVIPDAGHYLVKFEAPQVAEILTRPIDSWVTESGGTGEAAPIEPRDGKPDAVAAPGVAVRGLGKGSLREFLIVSLGQLVSLNGSALTGFALGLWVFLQTGSVTRFALIAVFSLLPSIVVSPVAGAVVDRSSRRLVMLVADAVAGVAVLGMGLLAWAGGLSLSAILILVSVVSLASAFQRPAYNSAIPQLVPKPYLGHANGFVQLANGTGQMVAPLVAVALLLTLGLHGVLLIDAASYALAVATLLVVRFPRALPRKRREPLAEEIANGFRYVVERPSMRALLGLFAAFNLFMAPLLISIPPLVLSFASETTVARLMVLGGVGGMLGGLVMSLWGGPRRYIMGVLGASLVVDVCILVAGLRPSALLVGLGIFGWFFGLAIANGCYNTIIQLKVPFRLQGRVFAFNQMIALSTLPVGYLLAGPLADRVFEPLLEPRGRLASTVGSSIGVGDGRGIALMFMTFALLMASIAVAAYRYPRLARLDDQLPDAIPDEALLVGKSERPAGVDPKAVGDGVSASARTGESVPARATRAVTRR